MKRGIQKKLLALMLILALIFGLMHVSTTPVNASYTVIRVKTDAELDDAIEDINSGFGDEIALDADVVCRRNIDPQKDFTLNLNGKTLYIDEGTYVGMFVTCETVRITGGGRIEHRSQNKFYSVAVAVFKYTFRPDKTRLIVDSGVTIEALEPVQIQCQENEHESKNTFVDIYGTLICTDGSKGYGISSVWKLTDTGGYPEITIHPGARVDASTNYGLAIFADGYAKWNIKGSVIGGTGIYATSGIVNVSSGAEIIGTGPAHDVYPANESATGSAIVMETEKAGYPITLNVTGGTVASVDKYAIEEYSKGLTSAASLSITGGTFASNSAAVISGEQSFLDKNKGTITGGKFSPVGLLSPGSRYLVLVHDDFMENSSGYIVAKPKFTVTFDSNGGSPVLSQTVAEGNTAYIPIQPAKANHDFVGWYRDKALTLPYNFSTPVTQDITLYAKWKLIPGSVFTVTFDSNGGSPVLPQTVEKNKTAYIPIKPAKADHDFVGWYRDKALTLPYNFATPVTQDITLYAKWKPIVATFTVTFDSNGGSPVPAQTVEKDKAAKKPADPAKADHAFDGWYRDKGLTKAYNFATPVTQDITLYAKWKPMTATTTAPTTTAPEESSAPTTTDPNESTAPATTAPDESAPATTTKPGESAEQTTEPSEPDASTEPGQTTDPKSPSKNESSGASLWFLWVLLGIGVGVGGVLLFLYLRKRQKPKP